MSDRIESLSVQAAQSLASSTARDPIDTSPAEAMASLM